TLLNIFDEGLRSHDARLKANAIEAVGELELPMREIVSRIEPYLEDPNNRIRANSVLALARGEPEKSRKVLVEMVESNDVQLRRSAAFILGQIPAQGNEPLAQKLIGDHSDDVRRRMVLSLKNFPADFAKSQIAIVLGDKNKWIRKHAVEIAAIYPEFPRDLILRLLKTEANYPNIVACMDFFGRHPDPEAVRIIRTKVKDKREPVVSGAIRAIGAMQAIPGLQAIAPQINYRDPQILRTFAMTLFNLGSLEIMDSILEKAGQIKKPPANDLYLPALDSCLESLNLGDKMPKNLMAELTRQASPAPAPVVPEPVVVQPVTPAAPIAPVAAVPPTPPAMATPTPVTSPAPTPVAPPPSPPPAGEPAGTSSEAAEAASGTGEDISEELDLTELVGLTKPETPVQPAAPAAAAPPPKPPRAPKPRQPEEFTAGVKFFNLGKYKKARASFIAALEEKPDLAKAHYYLGMIAVEEKDWEAVRDSLSVYLETEPGNTKVCLALGRAYKMLRDWPGVVRTLDQIIDAELAPKAQLRVYRDLGTGNIFLKKYAEARTLLEKAFHEDPSDPEVNFHLAMSCFHLHDLERADTLLNDLLKHLSPDNRLYSMAESLQEKVRATMVTQGSSASDEEEPDLPETPPPTIPSPVNGVYDLSDPGTSQTPDTVLEVKPTAPAEPEPAPDLTLLEPEPVVPTPDKPTDSSEPQFLDLTDLTLDPPANQPGKPVTESVDLFDLSEVVTPQSETGEPVLPDSTDLNFEPVEPKKPAPAKKPTQPARPKKPGPGDDSEGGGEPQGGKGPDFSLPSI
ncbi:MAG TPA: HEAT repeat domain-containing protein, partial [Candidatus Ozemobacteraceae bacterium]|nr:HEAT repeat domain-containing protein [Candidatus Ozemobacteraceae bacterium]